MYVYIIQDSGVFVLNKLPSFPHLSPPILSFSNISQRCLTFIKRFVYNPADAARLVNSH